VQISDFCRFGGNFHYKSKYPNGTLKQWDVMDSNSDERIMRELRDNGPGVVMIHGNETILQHYVSGVFNPSNCSTLVNHSVQVVGWGSENGKDYWIIKNSWGTHWGESGFFRLARGKNLCGFNIWYFYPILQNAKFINKSADF
jgi:hypothetical protein